MFRALGFVLIMWVPFLLSGTPSCAVDNAMLRILQWLGAGIVAIAVVLWLYGLESLPLMFAAYVPLLQMVAFRSLARRFKNQYGRDMQLIAFGMIGDPELKKDGNYSAAYFALALALPMLTYVFLFA